MRHTSFWLLPVALLLAACGGPQTPTFVPRDPDPLPITFQGSINLGPSSQDPAGRTVYAVTPYGKPSTLGQSKITADHRFTLTLDPTAVKANISPVYVSADDPSCTGKREINYLPGLVHVTPVVFQLSEDSVPNSSAGSPIVFQPLNSPPLAAGESYILEYFNSPASSDVDITCDRGYILEKIQSKLTYVRGWNLIFVKQTKSGLVSSTVFKSVDMPSALLLTTNLSTTEAGSAVPISSMP